MRRMPAYHVARAWPEVQGGRGGERRCDASRPRADVCRNTWNRFSEGVGKKLAEQMKLPFSNRLGIWFVLFAEVVLLTVLTSSLGGEHPFESTFLSWSNITQVIRSLSFIAIMVVGQSVFIISRW